MKCYNSEVNPSSPSFPSCSRDYFSDAAVPSRTSFTPVNSWGVENSSRYPTYSSFAPAKRQAEPTYNWPKRQNHDQSGGDRYPATPSSSHQPLATAKRRERPSFPSLELCSQAEPATLPAQEDLNSNDFYHPTPPSTEPAHLPFSEEGHISSSTMDGDHVNQGALSNLPFPDLEPLPYTESYHDYEHHQNDQAYADLQAHYTTGEPAGYSPPEESPIGDNGTNHISAVYRFLSYNSSKRAAKQAPAIQANFPYNQVDCTNKENDHFDGDSLDEEMAQLAEPQFDDTHQIPPSSVVRDMDAGSDTEIFDPRLQRSPPGDFKGPGDHEKVQDPESFDDGLLSSDVDWDAIMQPVPSSSCQVSLLQPVCKATMVAGNNSLIRDTQIGSFDNSVTSSKIQNTPSRQRIPTSYANCPPITIPKVQFKMRTFFRVAELINEGRMFFDVKQQPTFEFYAWVGESWREKDSKVKHFIFMDLYKEDRLELRGILSGWTMNGELDKQSSFFLSVNRKTNHKLCRCVCKVVQDQKYWMGWHLAVRWIQPATWGDISKKKN